MSDPVEPRPRPQYGEYATPEEQRAHIEDPGHWTSASAADDVAEAPVAPPPATRRPDRTATDAVKPRADRIITYALLGIGLLNVMLSVGSFLDFPSAARRTMEIMGIPGEFTNVAQGQVIGWIAAATLVIAWLATLWLSMRLIRRGRLSWWVPIAGAFVAYAIVTVLVSIVLYGDPAIRDSLISGSNLSLGAVL